MEVSHACLHFLIMLPYPYFTSYLSYITVTVWYCLMILCMIIQQVNGVVGRCDGAEDTSGAGTSYLFGL